MRRLVIVALLALLTAGCGTTDGKWCYEPVSVPLEPTNPNFPSGDSATAQLCMEFGPNLPH